MDDLKAGDASIADVADVAVVDSTTPPDAASDVVQTPDVGADATFCSTVDASFCDDFDLVPDASYFGLALLGGNGALAVNDAEVLTTPNSLDTYLPSLDAGSGRAVLYRSLATPPTRIAIDFDARVLNQPTRMAIATFAFTQSSLTWKLELVVDQASIAVREIVPTDAGLATVQHATINLTWGNAWRHVTLVWATNGNGRESALAIDQAPVEQNVALTAGWPNSNAAISIGIDEVYAPATVSNVYFDDVVIDLQ